MRPLRCDELAYGAWLIHGSRESGVRQATVTAEKVVLDTENGWVTITSPQQVAALLALLNRAWKLFDRAYYDKQVELAMKGGADASGNPS